MYTGVDLQEKEQKKPEPKNSIEPPPWYTVRNDKQTTTDGAARDLDTNDGEKRGLFDDLSASDSEDS